MFKICRRQFANSLLSPRFYIALLVGITVQSLNIVSLLEFTEVIGESACITDGFLLFNNDIFSLAASSLGIIILVSDIPFSSQNETYTLLRITRVEWVAGKILYLFCACVIYYTVVFLSGVVLLAGNIYCSNRWSQPIYLLATDASGSLQAQFGLSYPEYILTYFTPIQASLLCMIYSIAYAFVLSLVIFWLNLKCSTAVGYFFSIMFHVLNYFMTVIFPTSAFCKYSLLANSSLRYHRFEVYPQSHGLLTIEQSCLAFFATELLLLILIYFAVKKYDFKITIESSQ